MEWQMRTSDVKRNRAMLTARHPKVVLEIKDVEDAEGITTRKLSLNSEALPGRGEDDVLLLLAQQVLDATKIGNSTAKDAETRYNATIAALHEIAPVGPIEGMLSVQLNPPTWRLWITTSTSIRPMTATHMRITSIR